MKLLTKHFDELEVDESKIIRFADGLPGFPNDKRFILLENNAGQESTDTAEGRQVEQTVGDAPDNAEFNPFLWMQSVDDGDVAFILMDAFQVVPKYAPILNPADYAELGEYNNETKQDFLIYNIVVLPDDIKEMSVNLVAPVIINQRTKQGKQVVASNADYSVRYPLFKEQE